MKYAANYVKSAAIILSSFKNESPFSIYLKAFFAANKKFGSKDRKFIGQLCYQYFRTGKSLADLSLEEAIPVAVFLCNDQPYHWEILFNDKWINAWSPELHERIAFVQQEIIGFQHSLIFPFIDWVGKSVEKNPFIESHLVQPYLFVRIRPGRVQNVIKALEKADIAFTAINDHCLALANGTKLEGIGELDKDYVVQDYSSQRIAEFMEPAKSMRKGKDASIDIWDCCAASGGKSILARDVLGNVQLTVSDVRKSIIQNLNNRFQRAGIRQFDSVLVDLSEPLPAQVLQHKSFDLIICDAPCSGSGTWGRTPEQLSFFKPETILAYQQKQQAIVKSVLPKLRPGGYFLYITCSVFEAENEAVAEYVLQHFSDIALLNQKLFAGYAHRSDSMFASLFKKRD